MSRQRKSTKFIAVLAGVALLAAACGDDDDGGGGDDSTPSDETTEGGTDTEPGSDTTMGGDTTTPPDESTGDSTGGSASDVALKTPTGGFTAPEGEETPCGIPMGGWPEQETAAGSEVRVAWNQAFWSFNENTGTNNAVANANVDWLLDLSGFSFYDQNMTLINNDAFGTCELVSEDPLTISYTINEGVTWGDGTQVDAADMILTWGALSSQFDTVKSPSIDPESGKLVDENGNPVGKDQVAFDGATEAYKYITQFPEISDDGLTATVTYDKYYVDYPSNDISPEVPAHVIAANALGIDDPAEGKQAIIDAFQNNDKAALAKISNFWNTGFNAESMPDDPNLALGYGPYELTEFSDDGTMVFTAKSPEEYTSGPIPQVETIVYSIIEDPNAAVQALANEEVDIIQPQATADLLVQLGETTERGVDILAGDSGTYEHVDLAVANGGPFDPKTYGGDEEKAKLVRQAFLKAIPRQEILDRLIKPLNPEAELRNSQTQTAGTAEYDGVIAANGWEKLYKETDVEGAKALLQQAGVTEPVTVRFMTDSVNPRRQNELDLVRASVEQAGFTLEDASREDWGSMLSNPSVYDAALFGWQSTAISLTDSKANYVTGGLNNYYEWADKSVNDAYDELEGTTDPAQQIELLGQIENKILANGWSIPIFQHPGITAYNTNYVNGVSDIALGPTVFFNMWEWVPA